MSHVNYISIKLGGKKKPTRTGRKHFLDNSTHINIRKKLRIEKYRNYIKNDKNCIKRYKIQSENTEKYTILLERHIIFIQI